MSDSFLPPPGNRWNEGAFDLTDPAHLQMFEGTPWQLVNELIRRLGGAVVTRRH